MGTTPPLQPIEKVNNVPDFTENRIERHVKPCQSICLTFSVNILLRYNYIYKNKVIKYKNIKSCDIMLKKEVEQSYGSQTENLISRP